MQSRHSVWRAENRHAMSFNSNSAFSLWPAPCKTPGVFWQKKRLDVRGNVWGVCARAIPDDSELHYTVWFAQPERTDPCRLQLAHVSLFIGSDRLSWIWFSEAAFDFFFFLSICICVRAMQKERDYFFCFFLLLLLPRLFCCSWIHLVWARNESHMLRVFGRGDHYSPRLEGDWHQGEDNIEMRSLRLSAGVWS